MKVAVMNYSGNVGKSTIARHLLAPRMKDATVIAVESINSDGAQDEAIRGKQFGELLEALALVDDAVVDVGASNIEDFINLMRQYESSHEDFDFFVIPTSPKSKQQRDTISTIQALSEIGVPARKVRVVFNMVEFDAAPERVFSGIFDYQASSKNCVLHPAATIRESEIFGKLRGTTRGLSDILADPTDFKEKIKEAKGPDEKVQFAQLLAIKRLAAGASKEMDTAFKALFR